MNTLVSWARVALGMMAAGTVLLQFLLPLTAGYYGTMYWEVAHLVTPYSIAAVLMMVCVQAAIVGLWLLVSTVPRGTLFEPRTVVYIDLIRMAIGAAAAIPAGVAFHLLFFVQVGGPGVLLGFAATCVVGAALVILLTIARRVYLTARDEHADLEAVI